MSLQLEKGGNINLSKFDSSLINITVGLGWDVRQSGSETFDLDASILLIKKDGRVRSDKDFIFYNQRNSDCGAVHHTGDNRTGDGDGDDESIHVFLNKVPPEIHKLIICVSIFDALKKKQNFGQVLNACVRLVNKDNNEEVARFDLSEEASTYTVMTFGEIYRFQGEWKSRALGQGINGDLKQFLQLHGVDA
ncbi:MAG: TerD family protein [Methylovulum sp.]|nr:TerD family protein [Methylovulum sp.]